MQIILSQMCLLIMCMQTIHAQPKFSGTWKGFEITDTISSESKEIYFLDFIIINGLLEGEMRVEHNRKEINIIQVKGTRQYLDFQIIEKRILKSTSKQKHTESNRYYLKYNLNRGYLEGYKNDSSNKKIILFKSNFDFNTKLKPSKNKNWVNTTLSEYRNGLSSPEKRLEELKNFRFEPIYFEYDKSNVREEYHEQLKEIKKIILSHSDLRILVIGHTDSDGSNKYNESLSKRRAESIIRFFTTRGLRRDRIVIDFKGETLPVQSNKTSEGKSLNRRVDFKFI
ncbi:OmpA family protein [Crocinitomicaceae bacterium]|nr:OmpA family protein [Crocinitomicaceae bacterium]